MMKKLFAPLLTLALLLQVAVMPAFAASIHEVEVTEPDTLTYGVGDAYQANEIMFHVIYSDGTAKDVSHDKLTITANGTSVKQGYRFKEAGTKKMIVKYGEYEYQYTLKVTSASASGAKIRDVEVTEPETLTYGVGDAYQANEIMFHVIYSDGTAKDVSHEKLNFTANGNPVKQGYKFKEAGTKKMIVTFADYEYKYTLKVTASGSGGSSSKGVKEIKLVNQPKSLQYTVGEAFRADEVSIRCTYTNGTTETISGSKATITANGTAIKNGYKFVQAGPKTVSVTYGGKTLTYKLRVVPNVTKKIKSCEIISEPKTTSYKVGQAFRADEIAVRAYFTDGTYKDYDQYSIEVYAGGGTVQLDKWYKFKEKGTKNISVQFMDYEAKYTIKVV